MCNLHAAHKQTEQDFFFSFKYIISHIYTNGRVDRDAVLGGGSGWPKVPCIRWGSNFPAIGDSFCGDGVVQCKVGMATQPLPKLLWDSLLFWDALPHFYDQKSKTSFIIHNTRRSKHCILQRTWNSAASINFITYNEVQLSTWPHGCYFLCHTHTQRPNYTDLQNKGWLACFVQHVIAYASHSRRVTW